VNLYCQALLVAGFWFLTACRRQLAAVDVQYVIVDI
jgi:hypothetical protein